MTTNSTSMTFRAENWLTETTNNLTIKNKLLVIMWLSHWH